MLVTCGGDISFAHFALCKVQIDNEAPDPVSTATPIDWWFLTDKAYLAKAAVGHGLGIRLPKIADPETRAMVRMDILAWCAWAASKGVDMAVIEGFALAAVQRNPYELGGVGYITRRGWFRTGVPFRVYGPSQLKKFVCHKGGGWAKGMAKQIAMEKARERWPDAIARFDRFKGRTENGDCFEDLVDAFTLGVLGGVELMLRSGDLTLKELEHDAERAVFNETSKHQTENLLVRPITEQPEFLTDLYKSFIPKGE